MSTSEGVRPDPILIRELASIMADTGLTDFTYTHGELTLRLSRQAAAGRCDAPAPARPAPVAEPAGAVSPSGEEVRAPMLGTAYLASAPGEAPFVRVGDEVRVGQTLLLIEAMKSLNPVTAPCDGRIAAILVEDGMPVQFDQPLIRFGA